MKLDSIFQDNMVLQKGKNIPLSGTTVPNAVVELLFQKKKYYALSAPDGRFTILFPAEKESADERLSLHCQEENITLHHVAVGEVYLVSGQSNMAFMLKECRPGWQEMTADDLDGIRCLKIRPDCFYGEQRSFSGQWLPASESGGEISGCGFFFARKIHRHHGGIIGIIDASCGGTNIESWVSRETLLSHPAYREELFRYEKALSAEKPTGKDGLPDATEKLLAGVARLFPSEPPETEVVPHWEKEEFPDENWEEMQLPDSWTLAGHNHAGIFLFRREFEIPPAWEKKPLQLHLGAVDKGDVTFINGQKVGETGHGTSFETWNTLRVYEIPAEMVKPGRNLLALRVSSLVSTCLDGGLIGPEKEMYLCPADEPEKRITLAGCWKMKEICDAGTTGADFLRTLGTGYPGSLHILFDNMIFPLRNFPLRGILWYQGEANAISTAHVYASLLLGLIHDWRRNFGDPELDFFLIQLPEFGIPHYFAPHSQWALIREAQKKVSRDCRNTFCIVSLGMGDPWELHPQDKSPVGESAAATALSRLSGTPVETAPEVMKIEQTKECLILTWNVPVQIPREEFCGFVLSGKGGENFPAAVQKISSDMMKIAIPNGMDPVSLWYAWADNPICHGVTGENGIPVSPFRLTWENEKNNH